MNILYLTDPHVSDLPPVMRTTTPFVEVFAVKLANVLGSLPKKPDLGVIGGDLFHSSMPPLKTVLTVRKILEASSFPWVIVPGNHDLRYNAVSNVDTSALWLLRGYNVRVLRGADWIIPGVYGVPYGVARVETPGARTVILHDGFMDRPHDLLGVVCWEDLWPSFPDAELFLVGHIHQHYVLEDWGSLRTLVNPGPFCRRTFDEFKAKLVPRVVWFDSDNPVESYEVIEIAPVEDPRSANDPELRSVMDLRKWLAVPDDADLPPIDEGNVRSELSKLYSLTRGRDIDSELLDCCVDIFTKEGKDA